MGVYQKTLVVDAQGVPLGNAVGKLYDVNDTGNVAPLHPLTLSGGVFTADQVIANSDGVVPDFNMPGYNAVKWVSGSSENILIAINIIPSGGAPGQVLTKDTDTNYEVKWADPLGIAAGGIDGQVLVKDGSIAYATRWATLNASGTGSSNSGTGSALFAPGSVAFVRQDDLGNWPLRPTDRDDVMVIWVGVDTWPAIVPNGTTGPHSGDLFIEKRVV